MRAAVRWTRHFLWRGEVELRAEMGSRSETFLLPFLRLLASMGLRVHATKPGNAFRMSG